MSGQTVADLARFKACLPFMLIQECPLPSDWNNPKNFSNDAHDPGGATMCGVIQKEYDVYRKHNDLPVRSVRLLTQTEGEDIYNNSYWLPECSKLPTGLDLSFFDTAVNQGSHEAIKILQAVLGIPDDGEWGPQTDLAIKGTIDVAATIKAFTNRRQAVYRSLGTFRYFGSDWLRRASEIGAESLKMVVPK